MFSRRSGRSRQERTPGGQTRQNIALAAAPERTLPQVGMNHLTVVSVPGLDSWSSSAAIHTINLDFTPTAAQAALWDQYQVVNIRLRLFSQNYLTGGGTTTYTVPFVACFDPSNSGGTGNPTTVAQILSYRNSDALTFSGTYPERDYNVSRPTHMLDGAAVASTTLVTNPIRTDNSWIAGSVFIMPMASTSASLYWIKEFEVRYSKPRAEYTA
jgi:hypothetical protein